MCWTSKNEPTKLVATKDIECYKNFKLRDITFEQKSIFKFKFGKKKIIQLISLITKYLYIPYKKQQFINLKPIEVPYSLYGFEVCSFKDCDIIYYEIYAGYHSYGTIEKAKENIFFEDEIVVKCIIPKDTEYYINDDNEIVSSTIIVTDQIVY